MIRSRATILAALAATALAVSACASNTSSTTSNTSSTAASSTEVSSPEVSSPAASSADSSAGGSGSSSSAPGSSSDGSSSPASSPVGSSSAASGSAGGGSDLTGTTLTIGSANFSESELMMNIYGAALEAKGATINYKPKIGSREVYIPAVKDGSIDLIADYSGNLLAYKDPKTTAASSEDVFKALPAALGSDLKVLAQSEAQDKDSVTVTAATAAKYNLKSIGDLAAHAGDLIMGGPPELKTRADGLPGQKAKYNVVFGQLKVLDAGGPLSVAALKNGQVDAADIFTTDPAIEANKFVVLEDPKNMFTAQNVLPVINAKKDSPGVDAALNAVSAKLTTQVLSDLGKKAGSGTDLAQVATEWLKSQGLI